MYSLQYERGTDSARKTSRLGTTPKVRPTSTDVEDELASMRGTKDTDRISYPERKHLHGISNATEEPHSRAGDLNKEDDTEVFSSRNSRESSPAKSLQLGKRHNVKLASDKGI